MELSGWGLQWRVRKALSRAAMKRRGYAHKESRSPDFSFPSCFTSWRKAPSSFKAAVSSWIFNKDDE